MRGLLLDANVLLVHATGRASPSRLPKVTFGLLEPKREFERLALLLESARDLNTTMAALAEFGSLVESRLGLKEDGFVSFMEAYAEVFARLRVFDVTPAGLLGSPALFWGLSDCSLYEAARGARTPLLTRDDRLRAFCERNGVPVAPFYETLFAS